MATFRVSASQHRLVAEASFATLAEAQEVAGLFPEHLGVKAYAIDAYPAGVAVFTVLLVIDGALAQYDDFKEVAASHGFEVEWLPRTWRTEAAFVADLTEGVDAGSFTTEFKGPGQWRTRATA